MFVINWSAETISYRAHLSGSRRGPMAKHNIWPSAALAVLGVALGLSPQGSTVTGLPPAQVTPVKPVAVSALRSTLIAAPTPVARPSQTVVVRTPTPTRVAASRPTPTVQLRPTPRAATPTPTPKVEALTTSPPTATVEPLVDVVIQPLSNPPGVTPLPSIAPLE
jgi:hypothetical protein